MQVARCLGGVFSPASHSTFKELAENEGLSIKEIDDNEAPPAGCDQAIIDFGGETFFFAVPAGWEIPESWIDYEEADDDHRLRPMA